MTILPHSNGFQKIIYLYLRLCKYVEGCTNEINITQETLGNYIKIDDIVATKNMNKHN